MTTALAQKASTLAERMGAAPEMVALIKSQIAPEAPDDVIALYFARCQQLGADPLSRMLYVINRKRNVNENGEWKKLDNWQLQSSIDLFRSVAESHGEYAGQVGPFWCGDDAEWVDVWLRSTPPAAARVGILREGFKEPLFAVATWNEYAQYTDRDRTKLGGLWVTMPALMLAKVAEALALRKAFPTKLSGLYTSDEMAQAGTPTAPAVPAGALAAPTDDPEPDDATKRTQNAKVVREKPLTVTDLRKSFEVLSLLGEKRSLGVYLSDCGDKWLKPGAKPLKERSQSKTMLSDAEVLAANEIIQADIAKRREGKPADPNTPDEDALEGVLEDLEVRYCSECQAIVNPPSEVEPHKEGCSLGAPAPATDLPKPTEAHLTQLAIALLNLHGRDEEAKAEWLYATLGVDALDKITTDADVLLAIKTATAKK